ncbi:zinc carboxypeptidase-like [Leptidea sinapis]|uniref:zinc carboxypeptidase-like n=1 Tax=Leptidea sinapis TaxID=189913 RepID=UPI0021C435E1|nr:zinc carboxypeptidase-like [Leptidea sinapis]
MNLLVLIVCLAGNVDMIYSTYCGCKTMRPCYEEMLNNLLDVEEDPCIENVAIGASTISIFLRAIKQYCGELVELNDNHYTYENRILYEVVVKSQSTEAKPKIMIEAGQQAGSMPVMMALFLIEQLVACEEYSDMLSKADWVFLPSTNPDGQEYLRNDREPWKKNMVPIDDTLSLGVDISRNFDASWKDCGINDNVFSADYPGPAPNSENETVFITEMLEKHKTNLKVYVSLRRDGHALLYPLASSRKALTTLKEAQNKAGDIANKINQRSGTLQWFRNSSIYDMNGQAFCGHSVDYAFNKYAIPYAYEMRVFPESDTRILSNFQTLPKGYDVSLRNGYFTGIRELYNLVFNVKHH